MSRFRLTAPDGQTYEVTGPEGATEADAFAILQQQLGGGEQTEPQSRMDRRRANVPQPSLADELTGTPQPAPQMPAGAGTPQAPGPAPGVEYPQPTQSLGDAVGGFLQPAANAMQHVNTGMIGWIPGVRENAESLGNIVRPAGVEAQGYGERALDTMGQGLGFALGGHGMLAGRAAAMGPQGMQQAAQHIRNNPGAVSSLRNLGGQIRDFTVRRPGTALGMEASSGAGAGLGMEGMLDLSEALDLGPSATAAMETTGGLIGGFGAPAAASAISGGPIARAGRGIKNQFNELVHTGKLAGGETGGADAAWGPGGRRAAERLQGAVPEASRTPDASGRSPVTRAIDDAPDGIMPGRASGEEQLVAMERGLARHDPDFARDAATGRQQAESQSETQMRDMFGMGRSGEGWRHDVIQGTAAPGVNIPTGGQTDEMLNAAYKSFDTAYDAVRGVELPAGTTDRIRSTVAEVLESPDLLITTDPKIGERIGAWVLRLMPEGDSLRNVGDVTALRKKVRHQIRDAQRGQTDAARDKANILRSVEKRLTDVLNDSVDDTTAAAIKATDARYRQHMIVQDASWASQQQFKELTPESLQAAAGRAYGRGEMARGEIETPHAGVLGDDRSVVTSARHGLNIEKVRGKPDLARRMTRGMDGDQMDALKADFNNDLVDRAVSGEHISGKKLTEALAKERETMRAMGYSAEDMRNIDQLAANLRMVEDMTTAEITQFITDGAGRVMRGLAAIAGSSVGRGIAKRLSGGMAHSLILAGRGARFGEDIAHGLVVDNADALIRAALRDRELMKALLTRPTDAPAKVQAASRKLNAWLATVAEPPISEVTTPYDTPEGE